MKLDTALAAIVALERYTAELADILAARAKLMPNVDRADVDALATSLGSIEKVEAMAKALPSKPPLADLIGAFGSAKEFGDFVAGSLGGNAQALAALVDKGCKRKPAKLKELADAFAGDPAQLSNVLDGGGLGAHPDALAEVFATGCGGEVGKMVSFCATFDDTTKREQLRTALDEGGLGQAPAALGPLVNGDDGALLLKIGKDADKPALAKLVQSGGMGGKPPDHPATLKSVLLDALGSDPKKLKELYDGFPHDAQGDVPQLQSFLQAMNGKSQTGEAMAGERMADLMDGFKRRDPTNAGTTAQQVQKMAAFQGHVTTNVVAARATRESGAGGLAAAGAVLEARIDPAGGVTVGGALGAMPEGGQGLLIDLATSDDKARLEAAQAILATGPMQITALEGDTANRTADSEATEATRAAIKEVTDLSTALSKKTDGGTATEVAALSTACDALMLAAAAEPDKDVRAEATTKAKAALDIIKSALALQAIHAFGAVTGANDQKSALSRLAAVEQRIADDSTATEDEKQAMATLSQAAAQGLRAQVLAGQITDTSASADTVKADVASALGKADTDPAVTKEMADRKAAAEAATLRATHMVDVLKTAKPPVDPQLLAQAGEVAEQAALCGRATADAGAMGAALQAAKDVSAELAKLSKRLAAAAEFARVADAPAAKDGLVAAGEISALMQGLTRDVRDGVANASTAKAALEDALKAAQTSAIAAAELARLKAAGDSALDSAAQAAAERQAALDGTSVDDAKQTANTAAHKASEAAKTAIAALSGLSAPIDPVLIKAASDAAEACARTAGAATDKAERDAALTQGPLASKAASDALRANAGHMQAARASVATAKAKTKMSDTRALETAFCANIPANRAGVKAELDKAFAQIDEAASAELAVLAAADTDVQTARADATKAAAKAARPGARSIEGLKALTADMALQAKVATLAKTAATSAVTGLAMPPDSPWPPSGPPYAAPTAPVAPTADQLNKATVLVQAAISAATARVALATKYVDAAKEYDRLAKLIPEPERTTEEKADAKDIADIWNAGGTDKGAPKEKKDAADALVALVTLSDSLSEKAARTMKITQLSRMVFVSTNDYKMPPTTVNPAPDADLENAAGFASMTGTRAFKTVKMPDTSLSTTPPATGDDLLATGANMAKKPLPSIATASVAIPSHADSVMDLEHMCERHSRENFTYAPGELKDETDVLMSQFVKTRAGGLSRGPADEPTAAMMSIAEKNVRNIGTGKTTSLWPEGISATEIKDGAAAALTKLKAAAGNPSNFVAHVWAQSGHRLSDMLDNVTVGSHTLKVSLGVSATGDGTNTGDKINVRMFYPIGQESLTVKGCNNLKNALGT